MNSDWIEEGNGFIEVKRGRGNVVCHSEDDNEVGKGWTLSKGKSKRKIDAVIALAMAGDHGAVQALKQASEAHDLFSKQELLAGFMN